MGYQTLHCNIFGRMQEEGMLPNNVTITTILSSFADGTLLSVGKHIHSQIFGNGMKSDVFVGNALISMYSKCGHMKDAHEQFDSMLSRDNITWNTLIGGYAQSDDAYVVMNLFCKMCLQGIPPDQATYVSMLSAFVNESFWVVDCKESDFAMKALVVPYVVNNSDILENKETWNDENTGENTQSFIATKQYRDLDHDFHGSQSYWDFRLLGGRLMHTHIVCNGLDSDPVINNALLKFYGNCSSLRDMEVMFEKLSIHNVLSFNSIIMAYAQHHFEAKAIEMFDKMATEKVSPDNIAFVSILEACSNVASLIDGMQIHVKIMQHGFDSDVNVATAMMNLYAKCGSCEDAREVFDSLPQRKIVSWNAVMTGYIQCGQPEEALSLFQNMQQECLKPDKITFMNVFKACGSLGYLSQAKEMHALSEKHEFEFDQYLENTLIDAYGKCGDVKAAKQVFDGMEEHDVISWNALISAHAQSGHVQETFDYLHKMLLKGQNPNHITYVTILSVCNHAGLVEEGLHHFDNISRIYGIDYTHEHYACMIDLLGRSGCIEKVIVMLKDIPMQPNKMVWLTMLGACRKWGYVNLGRCAFEHVLQLDAKDGSAYICMANIYTEAEMQDEAMRIETMGVENQASLKSRQHMTNISPQCFAFLLE